mmetsp:Transcript_23786/g.42213  ORF Transcript_23786/g.42213 Transcript_23786/m.42213 type:complete len:167 (-) Transcript_23786:1604-2104(-)
MLCSILLCPDRMLDGSTIPKLSSDAKLLDCIALKDAPPGGERPDIRVPPPTDNTLPSGAVNVDSTELRFLSCMIRYFGTKISNKTEKQIIRMITDVTKKNAVVCFSEIYIMGTPMTNAWNMQTVAIAMYLDSLNSVAIPRPIYACHSAMIRAQQLIAMSGTKKGAV